MIDPDTDAPANAAIARWQSGRKSTTELVRVSRHWRSPADTLELRVDFECAGSKLQPSLSANIDGARYCLDDPVRLEPVLIPKPWGQEIWFSGMEARGESQVSGSGGSMGLGSYLALAPERLCRRQPIILLKVLDPRPEPVLGELYLEVHEEKREVYVVTAVDQRAWPDGRGQIRLGVNQAKRGEFESDDAFRAAFLAAVNRYEHCRQAIDSSDQAADKDDLEARERSAREETLSFIDCRTLIAGEVISVPTWVPHSLQQGVKVVEFQTPTYERYIISSSQRVLTQAGWDSAAAIRRMSLDAPFEARPEPVAEGIDRIVQFDDFSVWRARLAAGARMQLPEQTPYALAYCLSGRLELAGRSAPLILAAGQAAFIPAEAIGAPIRPAEDTALEGCLALLAAPGL